MLTLLENGEIIYYIVSKIMDFLKCKYRTTQIKLIVTRQSDLSTDYSLSNSSYASYTGSRVSKANMAGGSGS